MIRLFASSCLLHFLPDELQQLRYCQCLIYPLLQTTILAQPSVVVAPLPGHLTPTRETKMGWHQTEACPRAMGWARFRLCFLE
ncbi:hypothetical protein BDV09DRAFT_139524 [Aspergillus tetrazonus]